MDIFGECVRDDKIVYLFGIEAYKEGVKEKLPAGLYEFIEFNGVEPSAYVWSPYYLVCPLDRVNDEDWEDHCYCIDEWDYQSVVYPKKHGIRIVEERERDIEEMVHSGAMTRVNLN